MEFKLRRAGGGYYPDKGETGPLDKTIELYSIGDLTAIPENVDNDPLIISFGTVPEITIYDGYIE
jgi:hypothetical protein